MKKNGFTFIELLAMITVIGIIMVVAIPNISGMMKNQRLTQIKSDANSMVETAKMKASKEKFLSKPNARECIVFSLDYLNDEDNMTVGPNGGKYDLYDSFVVYTRVNDATTGSKYKYYVRLVENYKGKRTGIHFLDSDDISGLKTYHIETIEDNTNLTKNDNRAAGIAKLGLFATLSEVCTFPVKGYYSGGNYCTSINGVYYDDEGMPVSASRFMEVCS